MARVKIHENGKKFLKNRNKDVDNKILMAECIMGECIMGEKNRKEDKNSSRRAMIIYLFAN